MPEDFIFPHDEKIHGRLVYPLHRAVPVDENQQVGYRGEGDLQLPLALQELIIEAHIFEANGELIRHLLEKGQIAFFNPFPGVDLQHADHLVFSQQRDHDFDDRQLRGPAASRCRLCTLCGSGSSRMLCRRIPVNGFFLPDHLFQVLADDRFTLILILAAPGGDRTFVIEIGYQNDLANLFFLFDHIKAKSIKVE